MGQYTIIVINSRHGQLTLLNLLWSPPQSCPYLIFFQFIRKQFTASYEMDLQWAKVSSVMMQKVI